MSPFETKSIRVGFASLALTLLCAPVAAAPVLDQSFATIGDTNFNGGSSLLTWQQGVTAGLSGTLNSVEVYFNSVNLGQGIQFFVNQGAAWQSDANDFSANLNLVSGWNSIDVSAAGIALNAGDQFVIGLHGLGSGFDPSFRGSSADPYAGGAVFLNGSIYSGGEYDINFRTFVDKNVASVPEPASWALLGLGLAGLSALRRRR